MKLIKWFLCIFVSSILTDMLFETFTNWNWDLFEYDWPYKVLWMIIVVAMTSALTEKFDADW